MQHNFQPFHRRPCLHVHLAPMAVLSMLVATRPTFALSEECLVVSGNNLVLQMSPQCKAQLLTPTGKEGFVNRMDAHAQRLEANKASAAASRSAASNLKRLGQIASADGDAAARKSAGYANRAPNPSGSGEPIPSAPVSAGIPAYSNPARK